MQLDPKSIWLKDLTGRCFFPQGDRFNDFPESWTLLVEGSPRSDKKVLTLSSTGTSSSNSGPINCKGNFSGKSLSTTVKVFRAIMSTTSSGKVEFKSVDVTYVEITPSNCNIEHVQSHIQSRWGEEYVVVSNDGLPIGDCPATRGSELVLCIYNMHIHISIHYY